MRAMSVMLSAFVIASAASAQERSLAAFDLPRDVERRLTRVIEDPTTRRYEGAAVISADQVISSAVVAFDGPVTVAGKIEGELIVVGGDVEFQQGAAVAGDVTVIGGEAIGTDLAALGGTLTTYGEGFELFHRGERILAVNARRRWKDRVERDHGFGWGHSTIALRTGINYNRVEGLPIMIGPVIQTGGSSPTRIEALGILRTGAGETFDADQMGYQLRVEQFLGSEGVRIGGTARSLINPIEQWNLTDLEASLATFLFHEDQRDYFEHEGWGVYVRYHPTRSPIDVSVGYFDDEHASKAARDPWTLFGDGNWRRQPLVGEGQFRSVQGRFEFDGRDRDEFARSGFFVGARLTRGVGGLLVLPATLGPTAAVVMPEVPFDEKFTTGLLDLRLYRRVGSSGSLAFRGVGGGSLSEQALPPQFQHALGGAGTMPGYSLLSADCGARNTIVFRQGDSIRTYFPRYGCDRFAMGSIEYRGGFDFDFGGNFDLWGRSDEDWDWHVDANPNWMMFFNAGHGWALGDSRGSGAKNTGMLYDAGAGIVFGDFGIYAAVPLNGPDRNLNVFVRLGARF